METFSLSRLNEYIRRAIAVNFPEAIWVVAELVTIKESRGHVYLELAEKDQDEIIAQSNAVLWKSQYGLMKKQLGDHIHQILKDGNEIRIQVAVDYHIRFGLKLVVQSIDTAFSFGQIAINRKKIIEQLISEGRWQQNKQVVLPAVLQRIAIISSPTAAGNLDFIDQLNQNTFGYKYNVQLYEASMQGSYAENDIVQALQIIESKSSQYDCLIIIRGGGSKLDLIDFDSYKIAAQISASSLPVFTGIGHTIDESVSDLSAYKSLKTPTAVAEFILNHTREYEELLLEAFYEIGVHSNKLLNAQSRLLDIQSQDLSFSTDKIIYELTSELHQTSVSFQHGLTIMFTNFKHALQNHAIFLNANDPEVLFEKGFSILLLNGRKIDNSTTLTEGMEIENLVKGAKIYSTINKIWHQKK
ncbi:MAG: exodeoxyribonuclease VII large subunit [Bacteroidota bacterium]|nr:exodeoxyribonuclease VII large subunit [Bacteroidota bacterium]